MGKAASKERQRREENPDNDKPDTSNERKVTWDDHISPQEIKLEAKPPEILDEEVSEEVIAFSHSCWFANVVQSMFKRPSLGFATRP